MLKYLKIDNFAIIKSLQLEFPKGMTVFTGETGAGKSILVDAVEFLLGGRSSQELVRTGEALTGVEGIFALEPVDEIRDVLQSLELGHEDEVILRREISSDGRGRIFINGHLNTLKHLKKVSSFLADIHGQHDHQMLLHAENHILALDGFGAGAEMIEEVRKSHRRITELGQKIKVLSTDAMEILRRIDFLRHQISEIDRARLRPGEDVELKKEKFLLSNSAKMQELAQRGYALLYEGDHAILSQLLLCIKALEELSEYDPGVSKLAEKAGENRFQLEDLAFGLRDLSNVQRFDPNRLEEIESRLAEIDKLRIKYGDTVEAILAYREKADQELRQIHYSEEEKESLGKDLAAELERYRMLAQGLSEKRKRDAAELEKKIEAELGELAMEKSRFTVSITARNDPGSPIAVQGVPVTIGPIGWDSVEFLLSANPGEEPKPLCKIASGGEISRVMLALKTVISSGLAERTMILDELDAGIGGRVAESVGKKMKALAKRGQVFCVTHLPQIASMADKHFLVSKRVRRGRTEVQVEPLEKEGRVREIARMLAGEKITELAVEHARQFLHAGDK